MSRINDNHILALQGRRLDLHSEADMNIEVHPDLAAFIADMRTLNGDLTEEGYVNNLLELWVREDLEQHHTEESVRRFIGRAAPREEA
jgi:hypothetical protein